MITILLNRVLLKLIYCNLKSIVFEDVRSRNSSLGSAKIESICFICMRNSFLLSQINQ